jgi:exodeoxyribonuclease III
VRLLTWNVNSLRVRLPRVLEALALHRPDIVCLQETKCAPDGFPLPELTDAGYSAVHHSAGRWAGVAILARRPLVFTDPRLGLSAEPDVSEARWCEAGIDGPSVAGGLRVASVYVPNGRALDSPEYPRKLGFLDAMVARGASRGDERLIIAGDLNIAPADADVYDPPAFTGGTHVSAPERVRLAAVLASGMVDAYRHLHPDEVQYTWWDYRAGHFHKGFGLRIDLALVDSRLAPALTACGIDRNLRKGSKPSDHAPLLVDLEI